MTNHRPTCTSEVEQVRFWNKGQVLILTFSFLLKCLAVERVEVLEQRLNYNSVMEMEKALKLLSNRWIMERNGKKILASKHTCSCIIQHVCTVCMYLLDNVYNGMKLKVWARGKITKDIFLCVWLFTYLYSNWGWEFPDIPQFDRLIFGVRYEEPSISLKNSKDDHYALFPL